MTSTSEILDAALRLAPGERARLLDALAQSLEALELSGEWEAEISRRCKELDDPAYASEGRDAVMARIRERLGD